MSNASYDTELHQKAAIGTAAAKAHKVRSADLDLWFQSRFGTLVRPTAAVSPRYMIVQTQKRN
jgi:hypothetical protein